MIKIPNHAMQNLKLVSISTFVDYDEIWSIVIVSSPKLQKISETIREDVK